jgi:hypothetical protein
MELDGAIQLDFLENFTAPELSSNSSSSSQSQEVFQ